MKHVGLTGNAASGKSEVARCWRRVGVPVVDADQLARQAVEPGTPGLARVIEAFGEGILKVDGSLNRDGLRRRILDDADARRRLEEVIHPEVSRLRSDWVEQCRAAGETLIVSEVPLLFEAGLENTVDTTVTVDADPADQITRLTERRGLSLPEARALLAAQMDPDQKRARADLVIRNHGDLDELQRAAALQLGRLMKDVERPEPTAGQPTMGLDLHLHTVASRDCLSDPEAVLRRAAARGIDRLAITDHDLMDAALALHARYPDRIIPGEEVKTAEGIDVIGLYLTRAIEKGTSARDTIRQIREQGGIPYLPHPFARGKGGGGRFVEELAPLVDVIEVFNARLHPGRLNDLAPPVARRFGRLEGAGSDAHTVLEVGRARLEVPHHPNDAESLRKALARGRWTGRLSSNLVHLASTWAKIRKKLPSPPEFQR